MAVQEKNSEIINLLLEQKGININIKDEITNLSYLNKVQLLEFNGLFKSLWRKPLESGRNKIIEKIVPNGSVRYIINIILLVLLVITFILTILLIIGDEK